MRIARLLPVISLVGILITTRSLSAQGPTGRTFCFTRVSDSVVYLTTIFDTRLKAGSPYRSKIMGYEYNQYIKGRFDYRRGGPFDADCLLMNDASKLDSARKATELQVAQAKGRVVSVDWAYAPDSTEVKFSFEAQRTEGGYGPEYTIPNKEKGFCVTNSFTAPLYVSAMFDWPPPGVNHAAAEQAWGKYLAAKHAYSGQGTNPTEQNPTYCSDGSGRGDPARMIAARIAGAKAANRKIVETGWKFGAPPT